MFETVWELLQLAAMVTTALVLCRHHKGIVVTYNAVKDRDAANVEADRDLDRKLDALEREVTAQLGAVQKLSANDSVFLHQMTLLTNRVDTFTGEKGTHIETIPEDF